MKHTGKVQGAIAFIILTGFFVILYALITSKVDAGGMRDALLIMVGALAAMCTSVVNYYFGSSSGSARKDEIRAAQSVAAPEEEKKEPIRD